MGRCGGEASARYGHGSGDDGLAAMMHCGESDRGKARERHRENRREPKKGKGR